MRDLLYPTRRYGGQEGGESSGETVSGDSILARARASERVINIFFESRSVRARRCRYISNFLAATLSAGFAPASYAVDIIIRHPRPTRNDAWRPPRGEKKGEEEKERRRREIKRKKGERRKTRRKRRTRRWKKKYWHDAGPRNQ